MFFLRYGRHIYNFNLREINCKSVIFLKLSDIWYDFMVSMEIVRRALGKTGVEIVLKDNEGASCGSVIVSSKGAIPQRWGIWV